MSGSADPDPPQNFMDRRNTAAKEWYKTVTLAGSGSESISQMYGSADPDPHQNFMDPQHCCKGIPWQDPWVAGRVEREFNLIFLIKNCDLLTPRPP